MRATASTVVNKTPDFVYAIHRRLSCLPLIGVAFTLMNVLLVVALRHHLPIANAPIEVNGGSFMHKLGQLQWMILLFCVALFPLWLGLNVFNLLVARQQYFQWRSAVAYVAGMTLYGLLLLSSTNLSGWFFN